VKILHVLSVIVPALLVSACSSPAVNVARAPGTETADYQSFGFVHVANRPANPDRPSSFAPRAYRQLERTIGRTLEEHGYRWAGADQADMLVVYHLPSGRTAPMSEWTYLVSDRFRDIGQSAERAEALVIDIVDRRANRLVWRGWSDNVVAGRDDPGRKVDAAAARIVERFPTAAGGALASDPSIAERLTKKRPGR